MLIHLTKLRGCLHENGNFNTSSVKMCFIMTFCKTGFSLLVFRILLWNALIESGFIHPIVQFEQPIINFHKAHYLDFNKNMKLLSNILS